MAGGQTNSNQQSMNSVYFGGVVDHGQINITGDVGNGGTTFKADNSATGPNVDVGVSVGMGGGGGNGMPDMPFLMMLNAEDLEDLDEEDLQNLKFSVKKAFKKAKKGVSKAAKVVKKEAKVVGKTVKYEATHMTPARAAELVKAGALSPIDEAAFEYNTGVAVAGKAWKITAPKSYRKKGAIVDKAKLSKKTIKKAKVVVWEGAKIGTELCAKYSEDPRSKAACELTNKGMNIVDDVAATKKQMILVNLENNLYLY